MSYTLDFTATYHARYRMGRRLLLLAILAALLAVAWSLLWAFEGWASPTLAQQMSDYHGLAVPLLQRHQRWTQAEAAYQEVRPWYRIYWAESAPEVASNLMIKTSRLPRQLRPKQWTIKTGGACKLVYELHFHDLLPRRDQLEVARDQTSQLPPVDADFTIRMTDGYLSGMDSISVTVDFSLPAVDRVLPPPPQALLQIVRNAETRRRILMTHAFQDPYGAEQTLSTLLQNARDSTTALLGLDESGKAGWADRVAMAMDPGSILREMEVALRASQIPISQEIIDARTEWEALSTRRWPWQRIAKLEPPALIREIELLKELPESQLPPLHLLDSTIQRSRVLRQALEGGLTIHDVFDDDKADDLMLSLFAGWPMEDITFTVLRPPRSPTATLMLAPWRMTVARRGLARTGRLDAQDVVGRLAGIGQLNAGFVLETLEMEFDEERRVTKVDASGLLVVMHQAPAFSPQPNQKDIHVTPEAID